MSKYAKFKSNGSLLDLFLLLALGFVVLFILAFILIKPVDPKQKDIELEEQLLINLTWEDTAPNDLDMWLQTPDGELVSFRKKEHAGAVLERDDLGDDKDWVIVDGKRQPLFTNREVIRIKKLVDGTYYLTVQHYNMGTNNNGTAKGPEVIQFQVEVYDGKQHKTLAIFNSEVVVYAEKPVIKIIVKDGDIIGYSNSDKHLAVKAERSNYGGAR
jgi:hypothetical protein